ncbi:MAG: hypothetical protein E6G89_16045 [Alphaproteobacteria bacterium]|nr:MAG: hypothetical protein E6G89_16045 [Alphaproteobacteria bacterium]
MTAASILALTGMTIPSQSIDLGGAVSGAVGAAGGIAAGVSAGLGGGGVSATGSGSGSLGTGGSGIQAGATLNAGLTLKQKKALILKHKSKGPKGLNANANAQILGGQGNIAKANAHVAFGGSRKLTTNADANLFVGHKHAGGKVNVFASTGPVVLKGDAGANVLGGEGNIAGADANLALGSGPVSLEADGGANVGTTGAGGNVNVARLARGQCRRQCAWRAGQYSGRRCQSRPRQRASLARGRWRRQCRDHRRRRQCKCRAR